MKYRVNLSLCMSVYLRVSLWLIHSCKPFRNHPQHRKRVRVNFSPFLVHRNSVSLRCSCPGISLNQKIRQIANKFIHCLSLHLCPLVIRDNLANRQFRHSRWLFAGRGAVEAAAFLSVYLSVTLLFRTWFHFTNHFKALWRAIFIGSNYYLSVLCLAIDVDKLTGGRLGWWWPKLQQWTMDLDSSLLPHPPEGLN